MKRLFETELSKIEDHYKILIDKNADWDFAEFFTLNCHQATYIDKKVDEKIPFGIYVKYAGFKMYFYIIIPNGNSTCQIYKIVPSKNEYNEQIIMWLFQYLKNKN